MKRILSATFALVAVILTACQFLTPALVATPTTSSSTEAPTRIPPTESSTIEVEDGLEFTLAPGQNAVVANGALNVMLVGITGDQRCPRDLQCFMSGPVLLTISVQNGAGEPTEFNMQVLTDYKGFAEGGSFEGIQDRVEYEGYLIQIKRVTPYPIQSPDEIATEDYRVTFLATGQ